MGLDLVNKISYWDGFTKWVISPWRLSSTATPTSSLRNFLHSSQKLLNFEACPVLRARRSGMVQMSYLPMAPVINCNTHILIEELSALLPNTVEFWGMSCVKSLKIRKGARVFHVNYFLDSFVYFCFLGCQCTALISCQFPVKVVKGR